MPCCRNISVLLLPHRTLSCLQAVLAQEGGDRKIHVHLQCAAIFTLAPYDAAKRDLCSLLRLLCGFKDGTSFNWAPKAELHPLAAADQQALRKVTVPGLFGYCLKQRFTGATFKCASASSPA